MPIPQSLQHLPTLGGLVVPWITPRTGDGRYLFGSIDRDRQDQALRRRWCGVCGLPLQDQALRRRWCGVCGLPLRDRLVLMMRLSDLGRRCTNEPALHPWCAAYTSTACPMIAGRLDSYRASLPKLDEHMVAAADCAARQGAAAEPWFSIWLASYELVTNEGGLAASYAGSTPLRIRPITWRFLLADPGHERRGEDGPVLP